MVDRPNYGHAGGTPDPAATPRANVERPLERFLRTPPSPAFQQLDHEALMLDLLLADGERVGLSYAYLTKLSLSGDGTLAAEFGDTLVTITGRGLLALYQHLLTHQAYRVECAALPFDGGDGATWIKSISVTQRTQ